jgi:hypothetical protein
MNPVEGALGIGDGVHTSELSSRLLLALQYAAAWQVAGYKGRTLDRINATIRRLADMRARVDALQPFLNSGTLQDYNHLSMDWAALYREVALSSDLIKADPLDVQGVLDAIARAAAAAGSAALTGIEIAGAAAGLYLLWKFTR